MHIHNIFIDALAKCTACQRLSKPLETHGIPVCLRMMGTGAVKCGESYMS